MNRRLLIICVIIGIVFLISYCWANEVDTSKAVIHHTASYDVSAQTIDEWHKENGWKGNGYHIIIHPNGMIENGRPITQKGAHAPKRGRNHWIGIALIGNDDFTLTQKISLMGLLKILQVKKVERHHEECPGEGFDVEDVQRELDGAYIKQKNEQTR